MKIRKRALRGYAESSVREALDDIQYNHRARMRGLQEELEALQADNEELRFKLDQLNAVVKAEKREAVSDSQDRSAADKLLRMHKEQTKAVWHEIVKLNGLTEEQGRELADKLRSRSELLERAERRMADSLKNIAGNEEEAN